MAYMRDDNAPRYPSLLDPDFYLAAGAPRFSPVPRGDEATGLFVAAPSVAASLYPSGTPFGPRFADATRWYNADGGRRASDWPTNGNWCGQYWSGGQYSPPGAPMGKAPPLDSGDEACMRHDFCYDRAGTDRAQLSTCDQSLIDELRALPNDSRQWPKPPRSGTESDTENFRDYMLDIFPIRRRLRDWGY
jgi:hypothetical protein